MKGVMQLGTTIVVVQDENFSVHYQQGYQRFQREYKGLRLTDRILYDFLARTLMDVLNMPTSNAGYAIGWIAALLEKEPNHATYQADVLVETVLETVEGHQFS